MTSTPRLDAALELPGVRDTLLRLAAEAARAQGRRLSDLRVT